MTSACIVHASTSSWMNDHTESGSKKKSMGRGEKAAMAGASTVGLAVWPVIISTVVAGPIGLIVSGGISLAVVATTSAITYAVTDDDKR